MQPRPHPALVIPQAKVLFRILMQPLDRPAAVAEPELPLQRAAIQAPGEVPRGVTRLSRQRPLADQPALRAGDVIEPAMDPEPAGLPLAWRRPVGRPAIARSR